MVYPTRSTLRVLEKHARMTVEARWNVDRGDPQKPRIHPTLSGPLPYLTNLAKRGRSIQGLKDMPLQPSRRFNPRLLVF